MNRNISLVILALTAITVASLPAQSPGTTLTPGVLGKVLGKISETGANYELPAKIANALGLGAVGQSWPYRQISASFSRDNFNHGFAVGRGNDQDLLISIKHPDEIHSFRIRRDGRVVTALIYVPQTGNIFPRTPGEAQGEVDAEIAAWARGIDTFKTPP